MSSNITFTINGFTFNPQNEIVRQMMNSYDGLIEGYLIKSVLERML
jgi:hypothetical protein